MSADVCVVGGGYTGLWTAIRLKALEPSLDVALVEAETCGSGASGRNGGFVLSFWAKLPTLKKLYGSHEAVRIAQASAAAVGEIGTFCAQHDIDAHYRPDGWLWTATSEAQVGLWEPTLAEARAGGVAPFTRLEPAEVSRRAGSSAQLAGVFEPTAATVQPALLAHGLRRVALESGVQIFEHSPMVALDRSARPVVRTAGGAVSAGAVVLALNAWACRIRELRRAIAVVSSDMVATEPVPGCAGGCRAAHGRCDLGLSPARALLASNARRSYRVREGWRHTRVPWPGEPPIRRAVAVRAPDDREPPSVLPVAGRRGSADQLDGSDRPLRDGVAVLWPVGWPGRHCLRRWLLREWCRPELPGRTHSGVACASAGGRVVDDGTRERAPPRRFRPSRFATWAGGLSDGPWLPRSEPRTQTAVPAT